jgi:amino acid transporter
MESREPTTELARGALRYPEIVMQSLTNVAPAIAILFYLQLLAPLAGAAIPLVMLVAGLIMLMAAVAAGQLAKKLTSAGGYYSWVSKTLSQPTGFVVGWFSFLYTPLGLAFIPVFLGYIVQQSIQARYGVDVPWWAFFLGCVVIVGILCYRGITISGRALLLLGTFEVLVVFALGLSGLISPGRGGVNLLPFNPAQLPGIHSIYLAVVYTVSAYVGWEAAAPIAEESDNPERNVPRAMIIASVISLILFVFTFWGLIIGWGTSAIASLATSQGLPPIVLAQRFWGPAWIIVLLVMFNSTLGSMISGTNVATRMWFDMSRKGILPRQFAVLHPKYKNPTFALAFSIIIALGLGLGLGFTLGPVEEFAFIALMGSITTTLYYVLANAGVVTLYRGRFRSEWNPILHLVFPVVTSVVLIWVLYKSLWPLPSGAIKWAPVASLAWLAIAIGLMIAMKVRRQGLYRPIDEPVLDTHGNPIAESPAEQMWKS